MSETLVKIKASFLEARKAREKTKSDFLGTLIGDVESRATVGSDGNKTVSEDTVINVLKAFQKKNTETLQILKDRDIISTKDLQEKIIIESFLPTQLTAEEIKDILISRNVEPSVGVAMKFLKDNYSGQYDGKLASQVVKEWIA